MTRKSMLFVVAAALLAFTAAAYAQDKNVGTWKLNVAKSKFDPGPAPKSQTLTIKADGANGVQFMSEGMDADNKPTHFMFTAKYDGKDVAVAGNPDFDMLAYKRVDANTLDVTTKRGGTVVGTGKVTVSADGKTRTVTQMGVNAKGQKVNNTMVYDKQ